MGRLTKEIESKVSEYFINENGLLVNISDRQEANRVSELIKEYCDACGKCLAGAPVISLGEIERSLRNSGLFATGLLEIKNKEECYVVGNL